MNNIKLEKNENTIYEIIAQGISLNNENLSFYSINENDIEKLIKEAIIIPIKENTSHNNTSNNITENKHKYIINDTSKLYQYGIKLQTDKQFQKALRCFNKCYEIEPNNRKYSLRLLFTYVKEQQYQKAISLMLEIEKIDKDKYHSDNFIYLYLLSMLTNIEETIYQEIQNMDPGTLMNNDKINNLSKEMCNIRRAIYLNKFKYAFQLLIENMEFNYDYSIENKLLKELLKQTVNKEENIKRNIIKSIEKEKYLDIIKEFDRLKKQRYLNSRETYIYLLTETIINIKNTRVIPKITNTNTIYLYDAIKENNFTKAKQLNEEFLNKLKKDITNDPINILLEKINELILEIKLEIEKEKIILEDASTNDKEISMIKNIEIDDINPNNNKEILFAQELAYYIKSEHISIEYAQKQFGIVPSQVLLIKLIYARDYFIEGLNELGNKLLIEVEKSKDKTEEVNRLLNEIRRDKKFYKNRTNNNIITRRLIK